MGCQGNKNWKGLQQVEIRDFKAGQTVYVELAGNAGRGKTAEQCIEEWEIISVGRKYIRAGKRSEKFGVIGETIFEYRGNYKRFVQKTDYCIDYILYATRQEIEEKHEKNRLFREIEERFRYNLQKDITLKQLRSIHDILFQRKGAHNGQD